MAETIIPPKTQLAAPGSPLSDGAFRSEATSRLIIDIAAASSGELDLDQILHETLDRLRTVMRLTGGSIALIADDDLVVRAAIGPFADEALGQRLPRGPSRSWSVIETQEPWRTGDLTRAGGRMRGQAAASAVRSWMAVPLVRRGVGIGLIEVDSTEPDAFSLDDEQLLTAVVGVLAGHVELAAHHEEEQRSSALRDAFIGVISHELRTPITTIYGLALFLRRRAAELDAGTLAKTIQDVEEESDRLYRLVEDLLVLSRAERGRVEISTEPVNVGRLVARIVQAEAARHPERRFELDVAQMLDLVEAEPTYVEQVTRNLLTNAAKYSQPPTPIHVTVSEADREIIVRVLDEGIGIDASAAEQAFDLFFRAHAASRVASGAGIGLFVCRQLVEAMGGRTWLQPRDGVGSEAGFALPVADIDTAGDESLGDGAASS